jgi:hypothetical protein
MTENDEGAVRFHVFPFAGPGGGTIRPSADGQYIKHEDHERIVTALRERLAAAEGELNQARIDLREQAANAAGAHEDMTNACLEAVADRDQALARLGEAEKAVRLIRAKTIGELHIPEADAILDEIADTCDSFLARDSAGGNASATAAEVTEGMVQQSIMAYYAAIADAYDSQEDNAPPMSSDLRQAIGMRAALAAGLGKGRRG